MNLYTEKLLISYLQMLSYGGNVASVVCLPAIFVIPHVGEEFLFL